MTAYEGASFFLEREPEEHYDSSFCSMNLWQTLFDNALHSCVLLVGQFSNFFKKAIRYLYGCLHMGNHIILYGKLSSNIAKTIINVHSSLFVSPHLRFFVSLPHRFLFPNFPYNPSPIDYRLN